MHALSRFNRVWRTRWETWAWSSSGIGWDSRAGKVCRHSIHTVLVILIALTLVSMWPRKSGITKSSSERNLVVQNTPPMLVHKIVAAHLFGQTHSTIPSSGPAAQTINVDGIVFSSKSDTSEVVLTINGKTGVYRNEQTLPDGETVAVIESNLIQLKDGGGTRQLTLNMAQYGNSSLASAFATGTNVTDSAVQDSTFLPSLDNASSAQAASFTPESGMRAPQIPVTASPLEQLRALRSQLVITPHS